MSVAIENKSNVMLLLVLLFLLATVFPYIQFVPSNSYMQPYAIVLAIVLLMLRIDCFFRLGFFERFSLITIGCGGLILFTFYAYPWTNYHEYRYLLVYFSPVIFIPVFYLLINEFRNLVVSVLQAAIFTWLVVALVQKSIDPFFTTSLLGRWGESAMDIVVSGRGVLGFAPEPTHHGFHLLLMAASLVLLSNSKFSRVLCFSCVISATLLAASSSAVLALISGVFLWLLRFKLWLAVCAVLSAFVVFNFAYLIPEYIFQGNIRIVNLIGSFLQSPSQFLISDYSVNVRLGGIWVILSEVIHSGLMPKGISHEAWLIYRDEIIQSNYWLKDLSYAGPPSGFGALLYQAGFIVLPFLFLFHWRLLRSLPSGISEQVVVMSVPFIFISQFYISAPLFSLIFACSLRSYKNSGS